MELSDLAEPMLDRMLHGGDASVSIYRIETIEMGAILACPKGSPELLDFLTPLPAVH